MSQAVQETWVDWAKAHYTAEGALRNCRENLRLVLEERFGPLPEDLGQRVEANEDLVSLQNALRQALHIQSLEELSL